MNKHIARKNILFKRFLLSDKTFANEITIMILPNSEGWNPINQFWAPFVASEKKGNKIRNKKNVYKKGIFSWKKRNLINWIKTKTIEPNNIHKICFCTLENITPKNSVLKFPADSKINKEINDKNETVNKIGILIEKFWLKLKILFICFSI